MSVELWLWLRLLAYSSVQVRNLGLASLSHPYTVATANILRLTIDLTIVGGKIVYPKTRLEIGG